MLGTKANSERQSRNPSQNWPAAQEDQRPWKSKRLGIAENFPDDVVLDGNLKPLRGTRGKIPSLLNKQKFALRWSFPQEHRPEDICRGYSVLNGQIDSNA